MTIAEMVSKPESSLDNRHNVLLLSLRQSCIMALGAIEDYLGMEHSIVPRHKRKQKLPMRVEIAKIVSPDGSVFVTGEMVMNT